MDWAALAKQWMQFKDGDASATSTPPPPPPSIPPGGGQPAINSNSECSTQGESTWSGGFNGAGADEQAWAGSTANDWTTDMDIEVGFP